VLAILSDDKVIDAGISAMVVSIRLKTKIVDN
jgi:hypothetical protein